MPFSYSYLCCSWRLAGRLLTRRKVAKKPSTIGTDRGRIERHIKPLLGRMAVAAVDRTDIERFMHAVAEGETATKIKTKKRGLARVRGGKGTASRTVRESPERAIFSGYFFPGERDRGVMLSGDLSFLPAPAFKDLQYFVGVFNGNRFFNDNNRQVNYLVRVRKLFDAPVIGRRIAA